jgi:hypothetical protein
VEWRTGREIVRFQRDFTLNHEMNPQGLGALSRSCSGLRGK